MNPNFLSKTSRRIFLASYLLLDLPQWRLLGKAQTVRTLFACGWQSLVFSPAKYGSTAHTMHSTVRSSNCYFCQPHSSFCAPDLRTNRQESLWLNALDSRLGG